ncbi:xanthine dehydrogenase [Alkalibaculum sp. M08DMB]|uniref:Xanthine dehydrogenase n=2 Tax=Alkalibaculum sporogenes TaxID=2655001 RepID=A0A6A7K5X9_9FIRM|nr:xanthine dehydrogenase [Alkalibaculum sporogenes]
MKLLSKINAGERCVMLTYFNKVNGLTLDKVLITSEDKDKDLTDIYDKISVAYNSGNLEFYELENNINLLIEPFIPNPRLIIFGGGHISKPLTELATRIGFLVTVIDDRISFANQARFPEAKEIICNSFEKSFNEITFLKSDFVVIVTRGHSYDGIILREVLQHKLHYIGMIGSTRRVKGMMKELVDEGFPKDILEQVKSPIGLNIGAITPDEIAISIIAELIASKNNSKENKGSELNIEVMEKISEVSDIPKALITILSTKGSVPRKSGAKMISYYDGTTIGSIGGGCSEAAVLTKAREVIQRKGFIVEHVDMTGEVAESEGMVCGGVMDVLIETI